MVSLYGLNWDSLQHGGLKAVRLLTWQPASLRVSTQKIRAEVLAFPRPNLGSPVVHVLSYSNWSKKSQGEGI